MRRAVFGLLLLTAPAAADDGARAVVERATKAHGGAAALKKSATFTASAKGTRAVAGRDVAYTWKRDAALPGRLRQAITLGDRVTTTVSLDGDQAKQSEGGKVTDLRAARVKELKAEADVLWLATLAPLLGEGVTLSAAKGEKVDGEETVAVKAARKGHADAVLSFSKKTGLLLRVARRGTVAGEGVEQAWTFAGHKKVGGVLVPTKETYHEGGKKVSEVTIGGWSFPAK